MGSNWQREGRVVWGEARLFRDMWRIVRCITTSSPCDKGAENQDALVKEACLLGTLRFYRIRE